MKKNGLIDLLSTDDSPENTHKQAENEREKKRDSDPDRFDRMFQEELNLIENRRTDKFQHVWLVILPLLIALQVGGLVTYRWMIKSPLEIPEAQRNRIEELRRDGLWLLGSVCIVIAAIFASRRLTGAQPVH